MRFHKLLARLTGALLLSGVLCTVCPAQDHKENIADSIRVFSMSMLNEAAYEGEWISFYEEFQLYLPSEWQEFEVADSDAEKGIFYQAGKERSGENIVISKNTVKKTTTLAQMEEELKKEGYEAIEQLMINEIPVVRFRGRKIYGLCFLAEEDSLYSIICGPQSSEMTATTDNIFISLSLCEK